MRRLAFIFPLIALAYMTHAAERATSIPSPLADNDKELWRQVMRTFYGAYDKASSCWISRDDAKSYCMRPNTLHRIGNGTRLLLYMSVTGVPVDQEACHPCGGTIGFLVLAPNGKTLNLVARSEPYITDGTDGLPPSQQAFSLLRIGEPATYAWTVKVTSFFQGFAATDTHVYAVIGDQVKDAGSLRTGYSDTGLCENRTNVVRKEPCSDLSFEIAPEPGSASRFMPLVMTGSGTLKGEPYSGRFTVPFDTGKMIYADPPDLPRDMFF